MTEDIRTRLMREIADDRRKQAELYEQAAQPSYRIFNGRRYRYIGKCAEQGKRMRMAHYIYQGIHYRFESTNEHGIYRVYEEE